MTRGEERRRGGHDDRGDDDGDDMAVMSGPGQKPNANASEKERLSARRSIHGYRVRGRLSSVRPQSVDKLPFTPLAKTAVTVQLWGTATKQVAHAYSATSCSHRYFVPYILSSLWPSAIWSSRFHFNWGVNEALPRPLCQWQPHGGEGDRERGREKGSAYIKCISQILLYFVAAEQRQRQRLRP